MTAYLLHGYLGVGKTTVAKQLEAQHDAIRFTHDEWMVRLFGADPPGEQFQTFAARVSETMELVWRRCLELEMNVVLDLNFWSRKQRDYVRHIVSTYNQQAVMISVVCEDALARSRVQARNILEGSMYIAPETYDTLKSRFEPLDPDEIHYLIAT